MVKPIPPIIWRLETHWYRHPTTSVSPTVPGTPIYRLIAFLQLDAQNLLCGILWGEILWIRVFEYSVKMGNDFSIVKRKRYLYLAEDDIESIPQFCFPSSINVFLVRPFLMFRILVIKFPSRFHPIDNPWYPRCHEMVDKERDSTIGDGLVASKFKSLFDRQSPGRAVRTYDFQDEGYSVHADLANVVIHWTANRWRRILQQERRAC